jgi:hypothetical protein
MWQNTRPVREGKGFTVLRSAGLTAVCSVISEKPSNKSPTGAFPEAEMFTGVWPML